MADLRAIYNFSFNAIFLKKIVPPEKGFRAEQ
jgi:hypothetical protein